MKRIGLNDLTNLPIIDHTQSEYVIISSKDNNSAGFALASSGGFLIPIVGEFFKVKRIVANNLELKIMISDITLIMK